METCDARSLGEPRASHPEPRGRPADHHRPRGLIHPKGGAWPHRPARMCAVLRPLPPSVPATRAGLHRVAAHVLARRRQAYTGLIALRPSPGGVATPAFGDDVEVVRTSGAFLVVERAGVTNRIVLTTLAAAAELAGVDLGVGFRVGETTPEVGDPEASLDIDDLAARALGEWWSLGLQVLDELAVTEPAVTASEAPQLW